MTTLIDTTVNTVRRTRRAYLGALGFSYEFALKRAAYRSEQMKSLFGDLVVRGEAIEADALELMGRAKGEAEDAVDDARAALKAVKPSSTKRVTTLKTADAPVTAEEVAADSEGVALADMSERVQGFVERVQAYDSMANPEIVAKIVTHLGVALNSRDTRYVACSDEAERETVAKSWLVKKLGITGDAAALDAKVKAVCEIMKADRLKDRVTFYYLVAKNEGALGAI